MEGSIIMNLRTPRIVRNASLLAQSVLQHSVDDPALLLIQASRRLPFRARRIIGHAFRFTGMLAPGGIGIQALGAEMTGDTALATYCAERAAAGTITSRLAAEVAVMVDRPDLVPTKVPVVIRARAAWSQGRLDDAIQMLDDEGAAHTRYAARLRSELVLLETQHRIQVSALPQLVEPADDRADRRNVVFILTNSLPHTYSGYTLRSHRILRALKDRGANPVAITRTGYPIMIGKPLAADVDEIEGIAYHRVFPSRLGTTQEERLLAEVHAVIELARHHRADVLHTTTNYLNALVAQCASHALGIPWVLEVRGLMEQTWIAGRRTPEAKRAAEGSQRTRMTVQREGQLAQQADAVVTLSETMREELVDRGVERGRITLVPNGVDETLFGRDASTVSARQALGLDTSGFLVGAASALVDYEGFETLLHAVAGIVRSEESPAWLREKIGVLLIGDGVAAPGLRRLADTLGIGSRVHMPGRVTPQYAPTWVQALDLVCVPRRPGGVTQLVTPSKPVEAMALRRPVIMSDLPALREIAFTEQGLEAAELFSAGDADSLAEKILTLAQDDARRDQLVHAGHNHALRRSWNDLVSRYDAVYASAHATRP